MAVTVRTHQNLIGGSWISAADAQENRNPSDLDDVIGIYAEGDARDGNAAAAAARDAGPRWWGAGPQLRADFLGKVGTTLLARRNELGRLLSREEGKPLGEGVGEVVRAGQVFKFFAGEALRLSGDRIDSVRPGVDVEVLREPVGVVGLITPWNFPIAIPAWKIAPAATRSSLSPPRWTPASVHALAEILVECGCPAGVVNLVMGRGRIVGSALVDHPSVDAISFTGSADVGRALIGRCATSHKKVQAEMGGKNPMIVLDDADLQVAVSACVNAAFGSTGQRCTAASRLIIEKGILKEFVRALSEAAGALTVGNALDTSTHIGPVVSDAQLTNNLRYVALAAQEGASVIGGEALTRAARGFYQRPAVFLNASNDARTSREEIFGPCVSVIEARDFEHALDLANDTDFGLAAGICTRSLKHSREFKRRSKAGMVMVMVMVNLPTAGVDYHVPFGGRKGSSYGPREQGSSAVEFYTEVKTSYTFAV